MKEDFVTYELAVKLKEKGFPQHICDDAYITENEYDDDKYLVGERWDIQFIPDYCIVVAAPQIHEVLKWLREDGKTHIIIDISERGWFFNLRRLRTGYVIDGMPLGYSDSFEQSAISGIEYVIDNLI